MTNAVELQTAIEDAYGLLWLVVTDDPRLHAARARLLSKLDRDGQRRGIQGAKNMFGSTTMAEILQIDFTPAPEIAALRAEIERLREALKPFAKYAGDPSHIKQRAFLQLLICPLGDEHPDNHVPYFQAAQAAENLRGSNLIERGQAFANQVRAITYKLNGQAYSSTVSALNQFDADLRRARAAAATGALTVDADRPDTGKEDSQNELAFLKGTERGFMPKFKLGDRLTKTKGSSWNGKVVGFYTTSLTQTGYVIESEREPGSCQIYPEAALTRAAADGYGGEE